MELGTMSFANVENFFQEASQVVLIVRGAAICAASGVAGLGLGLIARAETSDTGINYPLEGGALGLVLCALAYAKWG